MKHVELKLLFSSVIAAVLLTGCANMTKADSPRVADASALILLHEPGVIHTHIDLWNRDRGIARYKRGEKTHALFLFKQAARYDDKPAQAMIASMYWSGDGVAVNRPLAYAWMDLAADRGYPKLLEQRELYWSQLSASERRQALAVGKTVYAEYGDAKAGRRIAHALRLFKLKATGSHLGFANDQEITTNAVEGRSTQKSVVYMGQRIDASKFYGPSLTSPAAYEKLKNMAWEAPNNYPGTVTVEPLQQQKPGQPE